MKNHVQSGDILKGVVAGIAAGLCGTVSMTAFQKVWSRATDTLRHEIEGENLHSPHRGTGDQPQSDDATMKAANRIAKSILNRELSRKEKEKAGPIVHFAFGSLTGAIYGGLAEVSPVVTLGQGSAFSTAVWLLGDEIAVPSLGLSAPPQEAPLSSHAYAFASHLVYGLATEWVRRGTRYLLGEAHSRPEATDTGKRSKLRPHHSWKHAA